MHVVIMLAKQYTRSQINKKYLGQQNRNIQLLNGDLLK